MAKWQDGELLHTLHHEQQWRLHNYGLSFTPKATLKDAVKIDADLAKEFPNEYATEHAQPKLTAIALSRLGKIER